MSFLKNTSIRAKVLSLLAPICLVGVAASLQLSNEFKKADGTYAAFIAMDNQAEVDLVASTRSLVGLAYAAHQLLSYKPGDTAYSVAKDFYKESASSLTARMEQAKKERPENAAELDGYITRGKQLVAQTDAALKPGIDADTARAALAQTDTLVQPLLGNMRDLTTSMKKDIIKRSGQLTGQTNLTIILSLAILAIVFAGSVIGALFVSSRGITKPIANLRERMVSLARGETEAPVAGQERRDEIGQMAAAVSVFRDNAIERIRLEEEAEANRSMSEKDRMRRDAEKAQAAADTQFAVEELGGALDHLARGDVAYRIEASFVEHLDALRTNFNTSVANLQESLRAVGENARGIDAGSNEIRSAADDLSKRTEQQAASVEETAAALAQITTAVKDSSRRADEVGALVARARSGAEKSGEVVRDAVTAMREIERSSDEITNIIGVIDEIAFQTNLLALNAGVEAARAGEAGKGFAVVAQEVRELAQRSAKAAKEIKELIATSGQHVRSGVTLVDDTGKALELIVAEVQEINRHVDAIVDSTREQSAGLQEINTAVGAMDQGTQQNAAMVEQSTAASHSLAREAASLNELLSRFNIGGESQRRGPQVVSSVARVSNPAARPSPARALGQRIASAFGGSPATAVQGVSWEEF